MKTYGEVDVWIHVFLISALYGGAWLALRPGRFTRGTHWKGGWVGPRSGREDVERENPGQ
jgi:hypothetical protein